MVILQEHHYFPDRPVSPNMPFSYLFFFICSFLFIFILPLKGTAASSIELSHKKQTILQGDLTFFFLPHFAMQQPF